MPLLQPKEPTPPPHFDSEVTPSSPTQETKEPAVPQPHRGYSLNVPPPVLPVHNGPGGGGLSLSQSRETGRGERAPSANGSARTFASDVSEAPPLNFHDAVQIYQIVSNRRAVFDGLLWSVPSTSFAAQAFLFQTALAGDSARAARIVSMALSILITILTLQLFTRQLQAESADHQWLEEWEERHQVHYKDCAHGKRWNEFRSQPPARARYFKYFASIRGFTLWSNGMLIIGLVALGGASIRPQGVAFGASTWG